MRIITAVSIASGAFITMAVAAHAQFSGQIPGVEHAQAQVLHAPLESNLAPLAADWRNPDQSNIQGNTTDSRYVTDPAEIKAIVEGVRKQSGSTTSVKAPTMSAETVLGQPQQSIPQIANSDCNIAIANAERKYGIPPHMLHAIAITESGRKGKPYPWAMNIQGRAHYAETPSEIVSIVGRYGSRSSIDIGCAQVNLKWHGHRFADWKSLIDPQTNADYAAYHLLELKREFGTWSKAVSAYHSRTSWRGANYACAVSRNYGKIFGDNRSGCGPDIELLAAHLVRSST